METSEHRAVTRDSGRQALIVPIASAAVVLCVIVGAFALLARSPQSRVHPPSIDAELAQYLDTLRVEPFELIDQNGQPVSEGVLTGGHVVLSFIFTHCQMACPAMFSNLLQVQDKLTGLPVRFVAISVDPAHDTPEQLRKHAEELGLDPSRWTLLTGEKQTIERIVKDDLKFALRDDPLNPIPLEDGSRMSNIVHPTKLLLLNPEGRFIGLYSGMEPEGADTLVTDVRSLLARSSQ